MADIAEVVDLLDRDGALDLGESPWKTYDEGRDLHPLDWDRLNETGGEISGIFHDLDPGFEEILGVPGDDLTENAGGAGGFWDTCAWYQPIHFFAYDWGIFVLEDCVFSAARRMARLANKADIKAEQARKPFSIAQAFLRSAFLSLFYHEHYHHRVECLGLRLHVATDTARYPDYVKKVYRPTCGTDDLLEEALANAHSFNRIDRLRSLPASVRDAARLYLLEAFHKSPPGYRMAPQYLGRPRFDPGENLLQGQVKEGILKPKQAAWEWNIAPRLTQSFFNIKSEIWVVVPAGARPKLPVGALPQSCSTSDMVRLYKTGGYVEDRAAGKGSHIKLRKPGKPPMILPNRKDLSPGVLNSALKQLGGFKTADLPDLLKGKIQLAP